MAKVVLITGCSSGFGLATALAFAERGDDVVATARDPSRIPEELTRLRLDVTDQGSINAAVAATVERHGRIDVLVNNAVIDAATNPDPPLRYLVAPHLTEVLSPAMVALDQLHAREISMTPGIPSRQA